jgi:hypothetical protein
MAGRWGIAVQDRSVLLPSPSWSTRFPSIDTQGGRAALRVQLQQRTVWPMRSARPARTVRPSIIPASKSHPMNRDWLTDRVLVSMILQTATSKINKLYSLPVALRSKCEFLLSRHHCSPRPDEVSSVASICFLANGHGLTVNCYFCL